MQELDLFAKWYVRDGEEFRADAEVAEVEAEGFLNGKPVIEADDEAIKAGVCPFSGLGAEKKGENGEAKESTGGCPFSGKAAAE